MVDFRNSLVLKDENMVQEHLDRLDSFNIEYVASYKDVNEDVLKEKLEECSIAQDETIRVEKMIRSDIATLRMLLKQQKALFKVSMNEILSEDSRKISVELKKASAENTLKDLVSYIADIEGWLVYIESCLEFVLTKKSDTKQKSIDFKTLYKIYASDKATGYRPIQAQWDQKLEQEENNPMFSSQ